MEEAHLFIVDRDSREIIGVIPQGESSRCGWNGLSQIHCWRKVTSWLFFIEFRRFGALHGPKKCIPHEFRARSKVQLGLKPLTIRFYGRHSNLQLGRYFMRVSALADHREDLQFTL